MIDKIKEALKILNIDKYIIRNEKVKSSELFFIKDTLDMPRYKEVETAFVTIFKKTFKEDRESMGEATVKIFPDMDIDEITNSLSLALETSIYAKNKPFNLADKETNVYLPIDVDLRSEASLFAKRMLSVKVDGAFLNSFEIFATLSTFNIVTSTGTDVTFDKYSINGEFIVQSKVEEDVELYKQFDYGIDNCDIENYVKESLEKAVIRSKAKRLLTSSTLRVLINGRDVAEIFEFFNSKINAGYIYNEYSDYKIGTKTPFDLTIKTVPTREFSSEGVKLRELTLLEGGVVKEISGGVKYSSYLGLKPNGIYDKLNVLDGEFDISSLQGVYLEVLEFSDFQMDTLSGQFSGEIRLGILHEDNIRIYVTGGAISGNILENKFKLSNDRQDFERLNGPKAILFEDVSISEA